MNMCGLIISSCAHETKPLWDKKNKQKNDDQFSR